ncbi:hypothetical protein BDN71DRAFT_1505216 [Pleurotus eryngii]|uniref:F-box domain-containing protein n=1 Tax=Pleurotus eryngii TaxID=5323 RepID=A0A9P5ZYQ7_PLEER|nr:hypothetical protein BDN71DRAFT_1505216 [Pleurotus eryngii]
MLPTLPWEIWAHIASYLSKDQLKKLYSVNRALYEISMDARYKTLWVEYLDKRTISRLRSVQDTPLVDREVHTVSATQDALTSIGSALLHRLYEAKPQHPDHVIGRVERHLRIIDCIWSLLSGRVESLSIRLWGGKTHFVCPTFSNVLGIKHLSVTLLGAFRGNAVAPGIANLINAASASLESFHLEISGIPSDSNHEIFGRLHPFPRVKRAHFAFCNAQAGSEAVTFLNTHGKGLEELKLSAVGVIPFSVAALQLPVLHKLSVDWSFCHNWTDHLKPGTNFPMLSCLKITGPCTKGHHIISFCDMLKRAGGSGLRHLELPCETMDAEAFDHFAEAFPNLHTLILQTTHLSSSSGSIPGWDVESFAAEMENREYSAWSLYDLEIRPVARAYGRFRYPWPSYEVMQIVASHVPSVRSFCGSGHMDSPNGAD